MADYAKLQGMLEAALTRAASECGMLLGQELAISDVAHRKVTKEDYFARLENAALFVGIDSQDEYQGRFHLVFALRDAIVLSSMLLGVPVARIAEKKRLAIFEPDDEDAFSEIANQVTGSFNTVFKPSLPKKVHLKQLSPKKFIPGKDEVTDEEPFADGEYCLFDAQIGIPGQDMERIELVLPVHLATLFDLQDGKVSAVEEEAPADEGEPVSGQPEEAGEQPATVLILEGDPAERDALRDILAATGMRPLDAPFDADIGSIFSREGIKAVLLGVESADDREFSLCARIRSYFPELPAPIIICAQQWTRTGVLKALKHGARDVVLKPYGHDELTAKVSRLLNVA